MNLRLVLTICSVTLGLGGCGFTPLYGEHSVSAGPGVVAEMSHVAIRQLPDRQGMRLRQVLREELQPHGSDGPSQYDLDVTLTTRVEELGVRKDATSSRANFILSASFYLSEGSQRVFGDRVQSTVSYNILDDQYATVTAQSDAEERAIREAGQEIKTRLAVYFVKRAKAQSTKAAP
ncbi:MAG: LPS assembly lipoprotein LptE [Rhodospirillaceae bacterium]